MKRFTKSISQTIVYVLAFFLANSSNSVVIWDGNWKEERIMKCFNHPDTDAIGICKTCNKGICKECVVDVGNGLACKNSCENEVLMLNELLSRSKTTHQKTGKAYTSGAIIYGLLGSLFLLFGLINVTLWGSNNLGLAFFTIFCGLIFLIGAALTYKSGRKIEKVD
jgi:hypothetical protein